MTIEHHFYGKEYILDYDKLPDNAVYPQLQHEAEVFYITKPEKISPFTLKVDAMITDKSGVVLTIGTADCAPIVLEDHDNQIIGIVHAGWKSACKGIIGHAIKNMEELGANPKSIQAFIGPCLCKESFEAQDDMMKTFIDKDEKNKEFFTEKSETHWYFDLNAFCVKELEEAGVDDIDVAEIDTYTDDNYHSFRGFEAQNPDIGYENGKYRNLTTVEITNI